METTFVTRNESTPPRRGFAKLSGRWRKSTGASTSICPATLQRRRRKNHASSSEWTNRSGSGVVNTLHCSRPRAFVLLAPVLGGEDPGEGRSGEQHDASRKAPHPNPPLRVRGRGK